RRLLARLPADVGDADTRALGGEEESGLAPDPAGRAGDDGDLAVESVHRGLPTLEEPLPLVGGHDLVEKRLLGPRVVAVVVDDVLAERLPRHLAVLEALDRVPQRVREALHVRLVRVAFELRR